ncbi:hypothetical protein NC652_015662 [Populus alba x Populus x berolinensis]|nr:hypothetical protein NC652_015662 [Populus alba x Populus x berolinensis]
MMSVDQVMDYVRAKSLSTSYVYSVTMAWKVQPAWFVKMVEDGAHQNAKRLRRKNAPRNAEDDSGSRGRCEKASLDNAFNTNISFYEPSPSKAHPAGRPNLKLKCPFTVHLSRCRSIGKTRKLSLDSSSSIIYTYNPAHQVSVAISAKNLARNASGDPNIAEGSQST